MRVLVTGGAGFIGSTLVKLLLQNTDYAVLNIDALSYAGNLQNLETIKEHPNYHFLRADINDAHVISGAVRDFRPQAAFHLAAHTHVDRSINSPSPFIHNNINGSYQLLEVICGYWQTLTESAQENFRFVQVSTDEVYGDREGKNAADESTQYNPSSPYAASKASADHLALAWHRTYGLPALITHCSNNYGPYQYPEKLIPLAIANALAGKAIPIYGDGLQIRDWLFVEDHAQALLNALKYGEPGQHYNIGGGVQVSNLELIQNICALLDAHLAESASGSAAERIKFVADRQGHDRMYALDDQLSRQKLHWAPEESLTSGLKKTVDWYIANSEWMLPGGDPAPAYTATRINT